MRGLFQNRFRRASHGRRRSSLGSSVTSLEKLEPRLALAGDVSRPLLERATNLYMDPSMHGPHPVVMGKSQVVGHDVKSFVISRVPAGSVVEKLDTATNTWVDVSTKPTSSNPRELLRLLQNRLIQQGDSLRWTPKAGTASSVQQAFEMIGWDDGSELLGVSAEAPSAVQNLEVNPTGVAELTVTWERPATGDATSYSVTLTTTDVTGSTSVSVYSTTNTSYKVSGLSPTSVYAFSVTASNARGTSPDQKTHFGGAVVNVAESTSALTIGLDGSIWVANENSNTIQQVTNAGGVWTAQEPITVGTNPSALTTGLDGTIWVANTGSNTVQQVTNIGGVWTTQDPITVGEAPNSLTTAVDGSIWVGNYSSSTAQQITNAGGEWNAQPAIALLGKPIVMTTMANGDIGVSSSVLDTTSGAVQTQSQLIKQADGVWTAGPKTSYSGTGDIIAVTTGFDGSIWTYGGPSPTSNQIEQNIYSVNAFAPYWTWEAQPSFSARGTTTALATGPDGSIWIANTEGTVQQILVPPTPVDVSAVFGPGPDQITLSWKNALGGTPLISSTATAWQGVSSQTVTNAEASCVFDGLTLGEGPTYFTLSTTNFAGVGQTAFQIDATGVPIPANKWTGIGISTDGAVIGGVGFSIRNGYKYSWEALGDADSGGALSGTSLVSGGISFDLSSPNQPNYLAAAGQTIVPTGTGSALTIVGASGAGSGGEENETITLSFTDQTTMTWNQSFSSWCAPQYYANESILSTQSYRNTASGRADDTTNYIYSYGYTLPAGKTLKSITLLNNPNVRILGAVLSEPTAVDLSWNAYGLDASPGQVPNKPAGFDGNGNYYNANYFAHYFNEYYGGALGLQTASNSDQDTDKWDYRTITWGGATFNLGPAPNKYSVSNNRQGNENFVRAYGQTIDLSSGDFSTLLMIGAGDNGNQNDQVITLTFTDGSTAQWTQSFTDWRNNKSTSNPPPSGAALAASGEALVAVTTVINQLGNQAGSKNNPANAFVYGYTYDIPAGKTLESITLPNNPNVGILGMALIPAPSVPTSAPQNLTATPVSINGLDIAWSRPEEVYGGSGTQITYEVTVVQGTYSYTEDTTATTLSLPQGLLLGTSYTVTVLPKTQYGDGTPATLTQVYPAP